MVQSRVDKPYAVSTLGSTNTIYMRDNHLISLVLCIQGWHAEIDFKFQASLAVC